MADLHDELVEFAARRWYETFMYSLEVLLEGGRVPGLPKVGKAEMAEFFQSQPPEFYHDLAMRNPLAARAIIQKFGVVSGEI